MRCRVRCDPLLSITFVEGAVEQALESYSNIAQGRQILLLFKPDTWTDPTSRTWTLNGDMLAGLFGQTTQQAGQSYHIGLSNELATVTLFMHYNQSIGESFNFRYPFQSQISLDKYQSFSVAYNVDNPQFQDVSPLLEIAWNGDNKTDAWLRLDKYASSPSIQIRQDGTYDIRVPSLPVEQDGFLHYQINVQRTLESLFPDKQLTQLVGFRLVLEKAFNADATGINAKNYTFYIKNVVVSGTDWSPLSMGVEASQGSVMAMNYLHMTPLNSTIYIPRDGFYQLQVRGASDLAPTNMTAVSDGVHMNFTLFSLSQGLQWHQSQRVYLTRGWSSLSIIPSGEARIYLDEILVSSADSPEVTSQLPTIDSQKINAAQYDLTVKASRPFYLVFSETYDPLWQISIDDGTQLRSYPAYSFGNFFFVNKTGTLRMTLQYQKVSIYQAGMYVSLGSVFGVVAILSIPPVLRKPRNRSFLATSNGSHRLLFKFNTSKPLRYQSHSKMHQKPN